MNNTQPTTEIDHADGRMNERSEGAKQKEENTLELDKDFTEQDQTNTEQTKANNALGQNKRPLLFNQLSTIPKKK